MISKCLSPQKLHQDIDTVFGLKDTVSSDNIFVADFF